MKKVLTLLTIGLFLSVASCSEEDDPIDNSFAVNPITNKQQTGSSSNDLLSDKKFKSMIIEVVYVDGFEPSTTAK